MSQRISQQQLESYLWGAATLLRGTIDAGDYKQFIFPLLFYKRICDVFDEETSEAMTESGGDTEFSSYPETHRFQIPSEAHWREVRQSAKNVGQHIQSAMRAIETVNPEKLYGIFGDAQWTNRDRLSDSMLRDLIEHFSALELTIANLPEDELGQGYEYLIKKFADDSGHTAAEFYTNRTVVHLMTELLQPQPEESIYDPTCGSGGMLLSCINQLRRQGKEWRNVRLYGQERNLMTSSIARMNCFLHGIEDFRIERGDTLSDPKFVQGDRLMQFDLVLANPPYSIKQWDREAFSTDPWGRNLYGTPPQGRADYAFWQHILKSLNPKTGRCAILFPHGVLFRQEEAEMRRKLIEADVIDCIIGMGPNLFYNSPMEACVVICRTAKPKARKGRILFINAVNEVTRERAQSFLTDDHIERIVKAYEGFMYEPRFTCVALLKEVNARDCSLGIPLYVESVEAEAADFSSGPDSLSAAIEHWDQSRQDVVESLHAFVPDISLPSSDRPLKALEVSAVFDRSNWQPVRFGDVVRMLKEQVDPMAGEVDRYVAGEHMATEDVHIRSWGIVGDGYLGPAFIRRFHKGQVLYGSRRTYLKKVALAEFDGVTANTTFVLEADETKLLQRLLPWLMLTERFTRHSIQESKGSTNPYINFPDIAKFEFALQPLDQQRRIADILWAVDEKLWSTSRLARAIDDYRQSLLESLAVEYSTHDSLVPLESVIAPGRPICYGILKPGLGCLEGIQVIKVRDYPDGHVQENGLLLTTPEIEAPYRRSRLQPGDLLVSIRGTVGRLAEVPPSLDGANITQDTARISVDPEHNHGFIRAMLESQFVQKQMQKRITGLAVKGINICEVRKLMLPVPPRPRQDEMARQLHLISQAKSAVINTMEADRRLLQATIDSLLGGDS